MLAKRFLTGLAGLIAKLVLMVQKPEKYRLNRHTIVTTSNGVDKPTPDLLYLRQAGGGDEAEVRPDGVFKFKIFGPARSAPLQSHFSALFSGVKIPQSLVSWLASDNSERGVGYQPCATRSSFPNF